MKKAVPYNLITSAIDQKSMDTLVYFLWLRTKFKKPIFYNFTYKQISLLLNCSPATAHKHINRMIDLKWAIIRDGHLCLKSNNKLITEKSYFIMAPISFKKREQIIFLRYAIARKNFDRQKEQIISKSEIVKNAKTNKPISKKQMRKVNKVGGLKKFESLILNEITLSNRKFGSLFDKSQSTGQRYQKQFREQGLIETNYRFVPVHFDLFRHELGQIIRSHVNGVFYRQLSNRIQPKH